MTKVVKVNSTWKGGMRIDAQARDHMVVVDQLPAGGGKDEGPNPMEYSLFALGGCLGTIAAIIANQERINLRGFSAEMEGDYDPAFLLGKTEEGRAGFSEIRVFVDIDADMTDEEKEVFMKKVDSRCPISDNLMNVSQVKFTVR